MDIIAKTEIERLKCALYLAAWKLSAAINAAKSFTFDTEDEEGASIEDILDKIFAEDWSSEETSKEGSLAIDLALLRNE